MGLANFLSLQRLKCDAVTDLTLGIWTLKRRWPCLYTDCRGSSIVWFGHRVPWWSPRQQVTFSLGRKISDRGNMLLCDYLSGTNSAISPPIKTIINN
ncbi:hypothetical protein J6590_101472 [Homalodisca vitripennis]|nr:hypothetical protein J6590_101472 [Homalodisca vitripennis]